MSWQERIVVDTEVLVGKPVIRGTRLSVELIVDLLAQGWTEADVLENYPRRSILCPHGGVAGGRTAF